MLAGGDQPLDRFYARRIRKVQVGDDEIEARAGKPGKRGGQRRREFHFALDRADGGEMALDHHRRCAIVLDDQDAHRPERCLVPSHVSKHTGWGHYTRCTCRARGGVAPRSSAIACAEIGRLKRKPCACSQPRPRRKCFCPSFSTPSAITAKPSVCAISMMVRTIVASPPW